MTQPVNVAEYEQLAKERMAPGAWDYIAGGAGDEITLKRNEAAFSKIPLHPRVLVDVAHTDTSTELLGARLTMPILLAPTGFQTLSHPDGELASARAAAAQGTVSVLSTLSAFTIEEVAAAATGPRWFQLYCYRDRGVTQRLVERAEAAGFVALCVTVDLARVGQRERDLRSGFQLPPEARPRNFDGLIDDRAAASGLGFAEYIGTLVDPSLTWEIVDWLRSVTTLPIVLKGIMRADDAQRGVDAGVDGIIVSNHGGRQLDTVPAPIDALLMIGMVARGRMPVLADGGIRRGTDVVKALALGAAAVLIGRPYVWGLAVDGEAGVARVLQLLKAETELAMALCGCPTVGDIDASLVTGLGWQGDGRQA
ncbi:MAG TPA: alpha-hydroxy acid oxidase [Gemmatimonadales bacterium]